MSQHGPLDDIPNCIDVAGRRLCLEVLVDYNATAVIELYSNVVKAESMTKERPPSYRTLQEWSPRDLMATLVAC